VELKKYFWDSYAIAEFLAGNRNYAGFSEEPVTITIFNLAEIYWIFIREYGEEKADELYEEYKPCVVQIEDDTLKEAIKFRNEVYKNKKISYADAIGYIHAKKQGMIFLTGDKEFEDLENVEFVK